MERARVIPKRNASRTSVIKSHALTNRSAVIRSPPDDQEAVHNGTAEMGHQEIGASAGQGRAPRALSASERFPWRAVSSAGYDCWQRASHAPFTHPW